ncbi:hypothetical protein [Luteimonas terrae]|uniref:DUF2946 domain-containing protein n=1 Tax=Luteimonas terrae TaxID=1530191 RepID=A0A4R5UED3_9GAMM|nr:hypothetical protein [Luteimonas terrae]TDK33668.1 hypothetical protein E2F49_06625 [Luteimonas terrae]
MTHGDHTPIEPQLRDRALAVLRVVAAALLFLMLWAATLGPTALAATASSGLLPDAAQFDHGGELPTPTEPASLAEAPRAPRGHLPQCTIIAVAALAAAPPVLRPSRRSRRRHPSARPRRQGPLRRQHRGRAPPR